MYARLWGRRALALKNKNTLEPNPSLTRDRDDKYGSVMATASSVPRHSVRLQQQACFFYTKTAQHCRETN